jgi:hypothetical protein
VEGPGANFHVIWLLYDAALFCPVFVQFEYDILEIHEFSSTKSARTAPAVAIAGCGII